MSNNWIDLSTLSLTNIWIIFIGASLVVIISALLIPKFLISLLGIKNQGSILIGVFLLSFITSVPEILTTFLLPFESLKTNEGIIKSFTQILGVNILIGCFFVISFLFLFKKIKSQKYSQKLKYTSLIIILILVYIISIFLFPDSNLNWKINKIKIISLFLVIGYGVFILLNTFHEQNEVPHIQEIKVNLFTYQKNKNLLLCWTIIFIHSLVFGILLLIRTTENLQTKYPSLNSTHIGFIFASVNASPEIWTYLSLIYYGFYGAGLGVMIGSILFNLIIFFSTDLILEQETWQILIKEGFELKLIWVCLLTAIVLLLSQFKIFQKTKKKYLILILIIIGFISSLLLI